MPFLTRLFYCFAVVCVVADIGLNTVQADETAGLMIGDEPFEAIGFFGTVTGDIELGLMLTSGNTDSFAIRTNSELVHELRYFRNKYSLQGLLQKNNIPDAESGEKQRVTTANRYGFTGQSNYKFVTGRQSIFGRAAYQRDEFSAFREHMSLVAGYGNRTYEQMTDYLDLETGLGYAHQQAANGNNNTGFIWYLAANLEYGFLNGSKFRQTFESSMSLDGENSSILSRSSITTKIVGSLAMRLNFIVKYNSDPAVKLHTTDTETSASLVYTF